MKGAAARKKGGADMTLMELSRKDVIQLGTGLKLGQIDDLEFDEQSACIKGIVLRGHLRWFGLRGKDDDVIIPWEQVETIGHDVVLVNTQFSIPGREKRQGLFSVFHNFVSG